MIDIEGLAALEKAATPGKWRQGYVFFSCKLDHGTAPDGRKELHGRGKCKYTFDEWADDAIHIINHDPGYTANDEQTPDSGVAGNYDYEQGGIIRKEDSDLICAMRNALPDLLTELAILRAIVQELAETELITFDEDTGYPECILCGKYEGHEPDCLISRAKEAMKK